VRAAESDELDLTHKITTLINCTLHTPLQEAVLIKSLPVDQNVSSPVDLLIFITAILHTVSVLVSNLC